MDPLTLVIGWSGTLLAGVIWLYKRQEAISDKRLAECRESEARERARGDEWQRMALHAVGLSVKLVETPPPPPREAS